MTPFRKLRLREETLTPRSRPLPQMVLPQQRSRRSTRRRMTASSTASSGSSTASPRTSRENTHDMIEGVFEISELRVRDIMIPRSQIIVVHDDDTEENILSIIASSRHSRYPVVGEDIDEIRGLLIAKDLLIYRNTHPKTFNIRDFMRPATIIPESVRVDRLLRKFQKERYHLAVVVDEFGSVSGLVTIEDVLEQIVGDIADEGEKSGTDNIKAVNSSSYLISGVTPIEDFNEKFGTEFSNDDAETIAGLLIKTCGHLPVKGETIVLAGKFKFRVVNADKRRVKQLELRLGK